MNMVLKLNGVIDVSAKWLNLDGMNNSIQI